MASAPFPHSPSMQDVALGILNVRGLDCNDMTVFHIPRLRSSSRSATLCIKYIVNISALHDFDDSS